MLSVLFTQKYTRKQIVEKKNSLVYAVKCTTGQALDY